MACGTGFENVVALICGVGTPRFFALSHRTSTVYTFSMSPSRIVHAKASRAVLFGALSKCTSSASLRTPWYLKRAISHTMGHTREYYLKVRCLHCTWMSVRFFFLCKTTWCFDAASFPSCSKSAAVQYDKRGKGIPWVLALPQRTDTSHVSSRSAQRMAHENINCSVFFAQAPGFISPSSFFTPTYQQARTPNTLNTLGLSIVWGRTCTPGRRCSGHLVGAKLLHVKKQRSWRCTPVPLSCNRTFQEAARPVPRRHRISLRIRTSFRRHRGAPTNGTRASNVSSRPLDVQEFHRQPGPRCT